MAEVTNNQVTPGRKAGVLTGLDFNQLYPLAGPIYVRGAAPGDILEIEILRLQTLDWGWTGIIPGLGLPAEDFQQPYLRHFDLRNGKTAALRDDIHIPHSALLRHHGRGAGCTRRLRCATHRQGRGQHRHAAPERGRETVPAGVCRRRALLGRRLPRRAGRRRSLRHWYRMPAPVLPALQRDQRSQPAPLELPVLHRARPDPASLRREGLFRHYGHWTRSDGECPQCGARYDRLARTRKASWARGCIYPVQPGRRLAHQPDRGRTKLVCRSTWR